MNNNRTVCDPERIELFLQQKLSDEEQTAFESHLSDCGDCRQRLEAAAAGDDIWSGVRDSLRAQQLPPDCQRGDSAFDSATGDEASSSQATVLKLLAPTDDDRMIGRWGTYEVVGVVGTGGMGVVLKAFEAALNRYVAIKVLAPHLGNSGAARKRFSREAQAAAAVVHDNVIEIHGVAETAGLPYLVMPYVRGPSLQRRLDAEGPLALVEILRVGMQAASGLAAAHAQGLVHRDVKPANILLADGVERVKLTDFGLARAADDASLTKTGIIAGTPQYMSPEQARGEAVDQRSDLFSLGSVLHAMCTGRAPFRAETSYGVLRRITDDEPRPIREINPEIPEWLCRIVAKLMSKHPDDRFQSAREVAGLLEECLAHVQQPTVVPLPAALPQPVPRRTWRPPVIRFKGVLAMITFLGAGLLGVLLTTAPSDIAGRWAGEDWGQVVLTPTAAGEYSGTFSDTVTEEPGKMALRWSRIERRFNGTWSEGEQRFGTLSIRLVDEDIRGAMTTDEKSKTNPTTPRLADFVWSRAKGKLRDSNTPTNFSRAESSTGDEADYIGKQPTAAVFGPVIEREIPFRAACLNLASGKLLPMSGMMPLAAEARRLHGDLFQPTTESDANSLAILDVWLIEFDSAAWGNLSASRLEEKFVQEAAGKRTSQSQSQTRIPPGVYGFKTYDKTGMLQVVGMTVTKPGSAAAGVKLRYKLVNNTQPQSNATVPHSATSTDSPRVVVSEFLRRLKAANEKKMDMQMVWDLTTSSKSASWGGDLTTLAVEERIHPLHQLGNDSQTLVLSAPFKDDIGRERIFSAILLKRDGRWLIDRHDAYRSRNEVESLLDGFLLSPGVQFDLQAAELVGKWHFPCASTLTLYPDGNGVRVYEGPSGVPEKPEHFRWEVSGATLRMHWPDRTDAATVTRLRDDAFRILDAKGQPEYFDYREEAIAPGSPHEIVVYDPRLTRQQTNCFGIDIERERIMDRDLVPKLDIADPHQTDAPLIAWTKEHRIDAVGRVVLTDRKLARLGLRTFEMLIIPAAADAWEKATPAQVAEKVRAGLADWSFIGQVNDVLTDGKAPATFFFQTREGSQGLLQILGAAENSGVKIRYKLVHAADIVTKRTSAQEKKTPAQGNTQ